MHLNLEPSANVVNSYPKRIWSGDKKINGGGGRISPREEYGLKVKVRCFHHKV